jgi:hypothetical protein
MAELEVEMQRRLSAARGEIDELEATPGAPEEKRERCQSLYAEMRSLRARLEETQWSQAFLRWKLDAGESGGEAQVFAVKVVTTV